MIDSPDHATAVSSLFSPTAVGEIAARNRIALAPLTRARAGTERLANHMMAEYYAQRAAAGLLIAEATVVSRQGIGWLNSPGIWSEEQAESWRQVVDAVHANDAPIVLQLWHCGRASHSDFHDGALPVAPSAVRLSGDGIHTPQGKKDHEVPRALETDEIPGVVDDYRKAARLARAAGFDGIEIHGANGYLIDQFLQSRTNQRTDRYGGSVENRVRFLDEVVGACLESWPAGRVGVRIAPNGVFNDMGSPDFRETFEHAARTLNRHQLAFLHVVDGLAFGFHGLGEPMRIEEFRPWFDGTLIANCGYDRDSAAESVASGKTDLVAFGRPFISNPDLVERFRNDWPLAPEADMAVWYSFGAEGYADFPTHNHSPAT